MEEYVDNVLVLEDVERYDIYQENRIKASLITFNAIMILKNTDLRALKK